MDANHMNKPPAKTHVERTAAGLQMVIPGCERRTLPKSTSRVDGAGQGLLHFYKPPSLREQLETGCRGAFAAKQRAKGNAEKRFVWLLKLLPVLAAPAGSALVIGKARPALVEIYGTPDPCLSLEQGLRRRQRLARYHAMLAKAALRRELLKVNSNRQSPAPDAPDGEQLAFAGF